MRVCVCTCGPFAGTLRICGDVSIGNGGGDGMPVGRTRHTLTTPMGTTFGACSGMDLWYRLKRKQMPASAHNTEAACRFGFESAMQLICSNGIKQ